MEIFRLRPNLSKTPNGGGYYLNNNQHLRKNQRALTKRPVALPSPSTTLLFPNLGGTPHRDGMSPKFDDISIHSSDINALLYGDSNMESNFGAHRLINSSPPHRHVAIRKFTDFDSSSMIVGHSGLLPQLTSSFILPEVKGYTEDPRNMPQSCDVETQTTFRIHLREYLASIKDHKVWRMERLDPFLEELQLELLKNKPANIEEFVIAICEARLDNQPLPETHKGHHGGESNTIVTNRNSTIKVQALPAGTGLVPVRAPGYKPSLTRGYYRTDERVGAMLIAQEFLKNNDSDLDDSRPVTGVP